MQLSSDYGRRWWIRLGLPALAGFWLAGCAPMSYDPLAYAMDERYPAQASRELRNKWGVWDDGDYFTQANLLDLREEYGLGVYYFSDVGSKHRDKLDLAALVRRGITPIRIFPRRMLAQDAELIRSPREIRRWATETLDDPAIKGLAVDFEYGYLLRDRAVSSQDLARLLQILSEEARSRGKMLVVTTFPSPDKVQEINGVSPAVVKRHADVLMPFEYSHGKRESYRGAVLDMIREWRDVAPRSTPVFALIDWGRGPALDGYADPQEAVKVPGHLRAEGVGGVAVFYAHTPYAVLNNRGQQFRFYESALKYRPQFRQLFQNLAENYGPRPREFIPPGRRGEAGGR